MKIITKISVRILSTIAWSVIENSSLAEYSVDNLLKKYFIGNSVGNRFDPSVQFLVGNERNLSKFSPVGNSVNNLFFFLKLKFKLTI